VLDHTLDNVPPLRQPDGGAPSTADTGWKLNTGILTYSRATGVFAGLTLTGAGEGRSALTFSGRFF
jgi:hypothetical protein